MSVLGNLCLWDEKRLSDHQLGRVDNFVGVGDVAHAGVGFLGDAAKRVAFLHRVADAFLRIVFGESWRRHGRPGGLASREGVNRCVAKGLAVVQGDADTDLINYPDDAFDYVILSQTLQATRQPRVVLENLLRIGRRAIVSFPNFGFWRMRLQLLIGGHMPRTENLPATWYDTPNIHFCTIKDFVQLCDEINVKMERAVALDLYGRPLRLSAPWWFWNMFGEQGVFLLSRAGKAK